MRRNCNLELGLFPPYVHDSGDERRHHEAEEQEEKQEQQHHQITIFYGGKICVSDVTELQAKSILMLANKKVEEKASMKPTGSKGSSSPIVQSTTTSNNNNNNDDQLNMSGTGLSMKRSLQRFLQKRKIRIQEASPYNH